MLGARTSRPPRSEAGISDIEDSRRFSRCALSADGTSDGMKQAPPAES